MNNCLDRKACLLQCALSRISLIVALEIPFFDDIFISRQNSPKSSVRTDRNFKILLLLTQI